MEIDTLKTEIFFLLVYAFFPGITLAATMTLTKLPQDL